MAEDVLQRILECNRSYLAGEHGLLPETGDPFIVVACIDPRLTGLLEPALGLPKHRAIIVRTAGNIASSSSPDVLRSIAAGIFMKGGREIFLVGHTDCAMAAFSTSSVIDSFRKLGISRSAFGDGDLRTWFGAFPDVRRNVVEGVEWLRRSGIVPADVGIHGLLLNTPDGKLEVLISKQAAPEQSTPPGEEEPEPELHREEPTQRPAPEVVPPPPPPAASQQAGKPVVIVKVAPRAPEGEAESPTSMADAIMRLRDFFVRESRDEHFRRSLTDLKNVLSRERNPARIVHALERITRDYEQRYPGLPGTIAYLKRGVEGRGTGGLQFLELIKRVLE
jgi:carbonic anhydrase